MRGTQHTKLVYQTKTQEKTNRTNVVYSLEETKQAPKNNKKTGKTIKTQHIYIYWIPYTIYVPKQPRSSWRGWNTNPQTNKKQNTGH